MREAVKLVRIVLAGLALYVLVKACMVLVQMIPFVSVGAEEWTDKLIYFGVPIISVAYAAILITVFIWKGDAIARKVVGFEGENQGTNLTIASVYRLICVGAGLLMMYRLIEGVVNTVASLITMREFHEELGRGPIEAPRLITWGLTTALAIYLLCGAPHFVRWQVGKTLEQCGQAGEGKDEAGEPLDGESGECDGERASG